MFLRQLFLIVLLAIPAVAQEAISPNDTARFLAGVPVRDTPLENLSRSPYWVEHATDFDRAWQQLETRQLAKIRAWGPEFLGDVYNDRTPVFYFFSGPDALYAQAFYPNAANYVLAGLEPVGPVPDIMHLPPGALASSLANLRKSLNSVLSFSFFITKDMKVDLRQNSLSGTLPVLYVFLARAGCRLDTVDLVWLDKAGNLVTTKTATSGVRIGFFGPSGARQNLYYFSTDLSNEGIKSQPGLTNFCTQLGQGRSLVKAASYLMHLGSFTSARDYLLSHCSTIVQDDSGIMIKDYDTSRWGMRYFGAYPGPIELFKQHFQADMHAIYQRSNPPQLPFGFGYRWRPSESSLILATSRTSSNPTSTSATAPPTP